MSTKIKKLHILFCFLVIFCFSTNFFYNIYYIYKRDVKERMIMSYGFCERESYGFINYLNLDYNFNIRIINEATKPSSEWFYYKINADYDQKRLIVLNNINTIKFLNSDNVNVLFENKNLGIFKVVIRVKNCFLLEKLSD